MTVSERFLRYVSFDTASDESSSSVPSTEKQKLLGAYIAEELRALGLLDARMDDKGYVYASLPANTEREAPSLGLIAHLDTSPECSGAGVRPRIALYEGADIPLNPEAGIFLRAADFPSLHAHLGQHLIVTDGTTLLGADDKAGAAEIVTALEQLIASGAEHGRVCAAFTPDEEIGRGADAFDIPGFGADYAYTLDGGRLGEVEYENFNAASAAVTLRGRSIHPGDAKRRMINANLLAMEFNALLPPGEIPGETEGYEGFFHLCSLTGSVESAELRYIIRDHDRTEFERRKRQMREAAERLCEKYGPGTAEVELRDSYYNMRQKVEPHMYIVDRARAALEKHGVTPVVKPIRGGTDGARLSFEGLPCPNLCTGGENYHSRFEYVPVEDMETMTAVLLTLIADAVGKPAESGSGE